MLGRPIARHGGDARENGRWRRVVYVCKHCSQVCIQTRRPLAGRCCCRWFCGTRCGSGELIAALCWWPLCPSKAGVGMNLPVHAASDLVPDVIAHQFIASTSRRLVCAGDLTGTGNWRGGRGEEQQAGAKAKSATGGAMQRRMLRAKRGMRSAWPWYTRRSHSTHACVCIQVVDGSGWVAGMYVDAYMYTDAQRIMYTTSLLTSGWAAGAAE